MIGWGVSNRMEGWLHCMFGILAFLWLRLLVPRICRFFFVMKIHDFISIFIFSCFFKAESFLYLVFFSFCGGNPPSHKCVLACILLQTFKRIFSCPSPIMIIKKATVEASLSKKNCGIDRRTKQDIWMRRVEKSIRGRMFLCALIRMTWFVLIPRILI